MNLRCIEHGKSGIQDSLSGIQLGKSQFEILLEGVDLAEHCNKLVVHVTNTDRAKNGIPVGFSEGKDGASAVTCDAEAWGGA